jgi:hypothetical protein
VSLNYLKIKGASKPSEFFPFDSENRPGSFDAALRAARAIDPSGCIAIFRPLGFYPDGTRCVGHAPVERRSAIPGKTAWTCANCGQVSED